MDNAEDLPPRLFALRADLTERIPCAPGDATVKAELGAMPLAQLMITYMSWVDRLIPPRQRSVSFAEGFFAKRLSDDQMRVIGVIGNMSAKGDDFTPYLSATVQTRGYTPKQGSRPGIRWVDGGRGHKDLALNTMDAHHFHLKPLEKNGTRLNGSRDLIWAWVSRDNIHFLMLGDHNSCNDGTLRAVVAKERLLAGWDVKGLSPSRSTSSLQDRLRLARYGVMAHEEVEAKVVPVGFASSDGSSFFHVTHVDKVMRVLRDWDSRLDTSHGRSELATKIGFPQIDIEGAKWGFLYGDFCLFTCQNIALGIVPWRR
ncbi:hypothetical protein QA648_18610 [Rhizobium sp. CB3171]|uniref:hypothetical protein n=1 Tax=Rhizobium sp. CB3171 TaxID=3039157 RepID=UPI0024B0B725|nr:hypothetical protein [Rhizobium sp. CB3171]WFU02082.1 hypothetical protein QA648_18610 [Rhizobium sp. CB3171]